MQLVGPLASGVVGAANGIAYIYERGTFTTAAWMPEFEGGQTYTTPVTLDGNGGAEVYVGQWVDVVGRDSCGNTVREFTAGDAADSVELVSSAVTGHDYSTGVAGTSKPTTVADWADLWLASAGAPDFQVLLGGVAVSLQEAAAGRQLYNVRDDLYGALGDGVTDDVTAIQAAITAAHNAGGGWVFFPGGNYRIATPLTWYADVSLIGCGSKASVITMDSATADHFNASGVAAPRTIVMGLSFTHAQACSGIIFDLTSTDRQHLFIDCLLGHIGLSQGALMDNPGTSARIHFMSCTFQTKATGIVVEDGRFTNCSFALGSSSGTNYLLRCTGDLHVESCKFDLSSVTGATVAAINVGSTNQAAIVGCHFLNSASSGTVTSIISTGSAKTTITGCHFGAFAGTSTGVCVDAGNTGEVTITGCTFSGTIGSTWTGIKVGGTETVLSESGNSWESGGLRKGEPALNPYSYTIDVSKSAQLQLGSRDSFRSIATQTGGGTKTLSSDLFGQIVL